MANRKMRDRRMTRVMEIIRAMGNIELELAVEEVYALGQIIPMLNSMIMKDPSLEAIGDLIAEYSFDELERHGIPFNERKNVEVVADIIQKNIPPMKIMMGADQLVTLGGTLFQHNDLFNRLEKSGVKLGLEKIIPASKDIALKIDAEYEQWSQAVKTSA